MELAANVAGVLAEFRNQRDSGNFDDEEVHELWVQTKREITDLFLQERWELSERTIRKEVQESLAPMSRPNENGELEPYFEEIINELRTESTYTTYLYFPELVEVPIGKKIGRLEIIEKPEDKENFIEHINLGFGSQAHATKLYEGRSWGKFEFDSYKRRAYIREELFDELQPVLGALKVSIGNISAPENLAGAIYNNEGYIWHLEPENEPSGWARYDERRAEPTLSKLSQILSKHESDLTPLERNILASLRLLTLHSRKYRNEHSFLTLIGALEGLLVTKYERPKSGKIAEKAVQLLYPDEIDHDISDKIDDYNRVKGWYRTRSEIIHGGYQKVTREEVRELERTVERVAVELVSLSDDYHSLQKQGGDNNPNKGLNDMFLEKRLRTASTDTETDGRDGSE